ncbi:type VI secretion protein, partial [Kutzneria sp. NPDC052558]
MSEDSVLARLLRDPSGTLTDLLGHLVSWVVIYGPMAGLGLMLLSTLTAAIRSWRAHRLRARLAEDSRVITILPGPTVDPSGAITFWSNIVGILRPRWARLLSGQPHVALEYGFDADGVRIQVWVPG